MPARGVPLRRPAVHRAIPIIAVVSDALAIVQARISSTRLPGKSVAEVVGEPMLVLLLRRLRQAQEVGRVVVATSIDPEDDRVEAVARGQEVDVYRGPLDDVLGRFAGAAEGHAGPSVRITADCPLIDPSVVDEVVRLFGKTSSCDYASNIEPTRTYPVGLDTEVFSTQILERLAKEVDGAYDREHVTTAIRRDLDRFRTASLLCEDRLGDLRWTVDTPADLEFVREIAARLGTRRYEADFREILQAVRAEPSLADFYGKRG